MLSLVGAASMSRHDLRALANLRHRDPDLVLERSRAYVEQLAPDDDRRPLALWVTGLARHELGEPALAVECYRTAIEAASALDDDEALALARASLSISLLGTGATGEARREMALARQVASPSTLGLVELLAALVAQRTGRLDDASAGYDRARRALRAGDDDADVARLLLNRGILRAYQADPGARDDLAEAERLARSLELPVLEAMAAHNLGFTEGRRGDIPAALAAFERAEASYRSRPRPSRHLATLESDRCETYLAAGLARDAGRAARLALTLLGDDGDLTDRTEARLLLARALLAAGDVGVAQAEATTAAQAFRTARRPSWAAVAEYVAMSAEVMAIEDLAEPPSPRLLDRLRRIARRLDSHGWPVEAMHVRTFLGRVALALDRPAVVRTELAGVRPTGPGHPALLRVEGWHATALLRLAEGDRAGAKRALRQGLRLVDQHRAALGATELRAGAAANGTELARLGLRLALDDGRPWEVLRWTERWRAGALRLRPVRPPDDPQLLEDLNRLRELRSETAAAQLADQPDRALQADVARLEASVRGRTMRGGDAEIDPSADDAGRPNLRAALGDRTMVELLSVEGVLHAVTVVRGRARLHTLTSVDEAATEAGYLRAGLRRLLQSPTAAERHGRSVAATARRLDDLLFAPLELPPGPLVLVPTGTLHRTAWAALPSLADRALTVTPSAELWRRGASGSRRRRPRVGVIVGPDLPGAEDEAHQIASHHRGATLLQGPQATVGAALDLLARTDLVHLAAHGRFRADSPLFSSLRLADGELTLYELERLRSGPSTLVLPACDAAVHDVHAGDELLGTAAALIGLGVASVIAPVLPVPDVATAPLVVAVHAGLADGLEPAHALARAAGAIDDDYGRAVAAAFVCVGVDRDGSDVTR